MVKRNPIRFIYHSIHTHIVIYILFGFDLKQEELLKRFVSLCHLQRMRGSDHGSFGGKRQSRSIQSRPRLGDFVTRIFLQLSIHRLRLSSFLGQEYPYISMALSDPVRGYRLLRTRSGKSNFFLNIYIYSSQYKENIWNQSLYQKYYT